MLEWISAARSLWPPARAVRRWLNKRGADRQALVREGSAVVTPVIEFAREVSPAAASIGEQEQIQTRVRGWYERWDQLRPTLYTYANQHPSERVRSLAHEFGDAMATVLGATQYFTFRFNSPDLAESYSRAEHRQTEAIRLAEQLMDEIRSY